MPAEQVTGVVTCKNCHQPHKNVSYNCTVTPCDAPVADPDDGADLPNYSPTGSYNEHEYTIAYNSGSDNDPTNPRGGGSVTEPDYIQFCLTCHDGTTPAGVTISGSMTNIANAYSGLGGETQDKHGPLPGPAAGGNAGKGGLKAPWVDLTDTSQGCKAGQTPIVCEEQGPYAAMNCTTCHGAHGTGSIFNLKSEITVAGTTMTVGGDGNMNDPSYAGDSSYTLPLIDPSTGVVNDLTGVQTDHNWGAWCSFCHRMNSHGVDEATDCTGGHRHGGGAF